MEEFLQQIEKALDYNLYYLALQSTLTLPDICGALESKDGTATKSKYLTWYNKHLKNCSNLSAEDCYFFRCSNLHQGKTVHKNSKYSRIIFIEPYSTTVICHDNIIAGALNIDLNIFCRCIIESVRDWLKTVKNNDTFKTNYKTFMKRYPNGLFPYIGGVPVIS